MNGRIRRICPAFLFAVLLLLPSLSIVSAGMPGTVEEAAFEVRLAPQDLLGRGGESIRRADFLRLAIMLYDALKGGGPEDNGEASALLRAYELGVIAEPEMAPDEPIDRQDAYILLTSLIDLAVEDADISLYARTSFEDHWQIASYAEAAVSYLYYHGIIGSPGNYEIEPLREVTMEEAISLVHTIYTVRDRLAAKVDISDTWEWRIEPVFDGLGPDTRFSNGLAAVSYNGKYGYIDREGDVVIDFQYDRAYDFSEGRARVVQNDKSGYIDKEGRVIVPLVYESGGNYSEEHVWVFDGEAYGFLNKYGDIAVPLQYEYAYDFKEGVAPVKRDGKYGYISPIGETVIPFQYDWASSFAEGFARTGSRGSYSYIDKTGQVTLELGYDYLFDFDDGRAVVFNRDQYAVIDREGEFIIPFRNWGMIYGFHDGLSRVHGDSGYEGNYTYIDTNGAIVIGGVPFQDAGDFSEGLATVATHVKSTNKISRSYVNREGELILPQRTEIGQESAHDDEAFYLQPFSEGLAAVVTWEGKLGFIENPLLKKPVRGQVLLVGADQPEEGEAYTLTYSLQAARHVSAQDITVTYDPYVLQLAGAPEILEAHTMIAASDTSEPGTIRLKLATLGSGHALGAEKELLRLRFQTSSEPRRGEALAKVQAVLADGAGNEFTVVPAWKYAVDRSGLQTLISTVQDMHDLAAEGSGPGQYAPGARLHLQSAIDRARNELEAPGTTQVALDASSTALSWAAEEFEGRKNNGTAPLPSIPPSVTHSSGGQTSGEHELGSVFENNGTIVLQVFAGKWKSMIDAAGKTIVMDVTDLGKMPIRAIEWPAQSFKEMYDAGKRLLIRSGGTSVLLPTGVIPSDGLAGNIRIVFADKGVAAGSGMYELTSVQEIGIQAGNRVVSLELPLQISFNLNGASGDLRKAGVYLLDASTGQWVYQRSVLNRSDSTLIFAGTNVLDTPIAVFLFDKTFRDVSAHWSKEAVEVLAAKHIVFGVSESDFAPEGDVNRAEFAALAVRVLGLDRVPYSGGFSDVDDVAWYADVIATAVQAGIVQGDGRGRVRPSDRITRQEMAVILMRVAGQLGLAAGKGSDGAYADDDRIETWARDAVADAQYWGLIRGKTGNQFAPLEYATRAEAAQVFYRLLERIGEL